jgi:hypothetical protein
MAITYSHPELTEGQKIVTVKFVNDDGLELTKVVNIPYNSDGSLNESYFQEILEGQLRSVEYKVSVGALEFGEPEPESTYVPPMWEEPTSSEE